MSKRRARSVSSCHIFLLGERDWCGCISFGGQSVDIRRETVCILTQSQLMMVRKSFSHLNPDHSTHFVHTVGWRRKGMGEVMNADSNDTTAMSEAL